MGETKKNLIKSWATPIRSIDNAEQGEILIYGEQVYANVNNEEGARIAGPNHWDYTYIYVNQGRENLFVKKDKQQHTPQELVVK
ncbi:hypothetical protein [Flavobacterium sp. SLB02]|uniref:hypothetical protein n=1 Tax=Flavobacterium sp. SLB02 TaxID=2665645 RepID=UPI001E5927F0|nr:hypothetical protein [Flavobacterium sp. SLB02]